ncbi:glycoside hydrolase family 26 protein [Hymenobacter sp. B1770]|uniref:glycoside hydrolase family 26 protein n=1 Tax=Hymenobacter sp. B1770 TaxID=1718788 RepID=UPI003CEE557C
MSISSKSVRTIIYRALAVVLIVIMGVSLFSLLLLAGNKGRGPLESLVGSIGSQVASFEKRMINGDSRASRSAALGWFKPYRENKLFLNNTDTLLIGAYDNNTVESYERIVSLEDSMGLKLPIIQFYTAWGSKKEQVFPMLRAQAISDLGSIALITWEPWLNDFDPESFPSASSPDQANVGGLKAIASGKYDAYLDKWAQDAKAYGKPFFLRFGHEMNDPYRYPWGPQNNKPEDFIAAWRHVVGRFRAHNATNAVWVWSPHPAYANYAEFYPGHGYVDWIGTTALNYGTVAPWSKWYSFEETLGKAYSELSLYSKPLMVSEMGSLSVGGDRATWFREALTALPVKFPAVKAVVFFNNSQDITTTYKALDWSFNADPGVLAAITQSLKGWKQPKLSAPKQPLAKAPAPGS